jgi:hypothetical protein
VHLRRALLLFAIVLGLAAVAASVSRPRSTSDPLRSPPPTTTAEDKPTATPAPEGAPAPIELTFSAASPRARGIQAGQAATVIVKVEEAGQVGIAGLGMSDEAEPLTPAHFDVLTQTTGRHPITFVPAGAEELAQRVGTLVVR